MTASTTKCKVVISLLILSVSCETQQITPTIREGKQFFIPSSYSNPNLAPIEYNPFLWNPNHGPFSTGLPVLRFPQPVLERELPFRFGGIEKPVFQEKCRRSPWLKPILEQCCKETAPCQPRSETITLCKDIPNILFGAATSSAPTGKVEGIGSESNDFCLAAIMAYAPNTKIEVTCPVFNVTTPLNVAIVDVSSATGNTMEPYPIQKNVVYTSRKNLLYITMRLNKPSDRFVCEWKAIP